MGTKISKKADRDAVELMRGYRKHSGSRDAYQRGYDNIKWRSYGRLERKSTGRPEKQ